MKKFFDTFFDYVFSAGTLIVCFIVAFTFLFNSAIDHDNRIKAMKAACYKSQMALVESDGGHACVALQNLVEIK